MDFLRKIFGFKEVKDENTANVNDATNNVERYFSNSSSSLDDSYELNTEHYSEQYLHSNKVFSDQGECLYEGLYSITNTYNLVDFEELIDRTQQKAIKTVQPTREFGNELNNFETFENKELTDKVDVLENLHNNGLVAVDFEAQNIDNSKENINEGTVHVDSESSLPEAKEVTVNMISGLSDKESTNTDDDGYNSSDFEFITENEAKMIGYIFNVKNHVSKTSKKDLYISSAFKNFRSEKRNVQSFDSYNCRNNNSSIEVDPGEGPSGANRPVEDYSNREYRDNHVVPEGDDYLDLFRGPLNPVLPLSDIIFMENKSIRPLYMNMQYEGIGFDGQLVGRRYELDSSEEEYEEEANESIKKIRLLYPGDNIILKRRRR